MGWIIMRGLQSCISGFEREAYGNVERPASVVGDGEESRKTPWWRMQSRDGP